MRVAVLGAGIMGSGIGQLAAASGHHVVVRDVEEASLDRGRAAVSSSVEQLRRKGRLSDDAVSDIWDHLEFTTEVGTAVKDADVVVEAVPEVLALKQEVLREASGHAPEGALLATNTSQLSITTIGAALDGAAGRLVGMHFFNPPVIMQLVELIRGLETTDETLERAVAFAAGLGKEIVVCQKDSPGFITTRAYAILRLECLRMLEEGVASVEDIDRALKLAFNFPMGPFELSDLNGVDTYLHAVTALRDAYGERFAPTSTLRNMVVANRLGRKTGSGFYRYDADGTRHPAEQP